MTSIDDLRRRAEAVEGRFGAMHDRARDYSDRLLKVMTGVEGRMAEQHERIADLEERLARSEAENEELRRMMHSLLSAIEGGNIGSDEPERLGPALRDLEARVEQLMAPPAPARPALGTAAASGAGMMAAIAAIAPPAETEAEEEPPLELTADLIDHPEEEPEAAPAPAAEAEPEPAWDFAPAPPATVDEDPLDLALPDEPPSAPAVEESGFTFTDDEPVAPAEDDFTFEEEAVTEPEPAPLRHAAEPEGLSPEDIAALLGNKPEAPAQDIAAGTADEAGWDDAFDLDMAAAMAEPEPEPAPAAPPARPALNDADTALMNSIMATIRENSAPAPEPAPVPEPVADPTAAHDDFDIDLDSLLSDAADEERARGQAAAPARSAFDDIDIPEPPPAPERPNDAHAPDFDPEIDAILQHVRKGIAMPGKS